MTHLVELGERGAQSDNPAFVRLRASMMLEAIEDLAQTIADRFLPRGERATSEALAAFNDDHGHDHPGASARARA